MLRSVAAGGTRAGSRVAFGIGAALALHAVVIAVMVGLVGQVAGSPVLKVVQLSGAAYLAYMGVTLLRGCFEASAAARTGEAGQLNTRYFLQGFMTNLTNPKAIVFFGSVVSQFISTRNIGGGAAVLLGVVTAVPIWFLLLSSFSARWITQLTTARRCTVDLIAAVLLLGLACFGGVAALCT